MEDLRWFDEVLFDKLAPADEVAAIIVEPIQGEGGYIVPEDGFLQGLRAICDQHGILLIADEIQSGAGRTGKMWAVDHWGVEPDILLTAKGIASGMTLGAMVARAELLETWGAGAHGSTYGGNPVACAAALATIELLEGGLIDNAAVRGEQAQAGLRPLIERSDGLVRDVRGKGLMLGIEFDTADHAEEVQWACFERGLLVLECGKSSVRMSPALTVSEAEMTTALRIFGEAIDDVADPRRRDRPRGDPGRRDARRRGRRLTDRQRDGDTGRVSTNKVATMRDAIATLVRDGDTVAIEGFTHLISFAAGHEIIRQRKRDLTLARLTPDVIYDQMIAAGVARKLVFSWLGNPGVGGLGAIRRRIEGEIGDQPLEVEEYSHFGMVGRYTAGAMNLPFFPLRSYFETDLPVANPLIRPIASPYGDETVYAVPPLRPDVTIVHAQRASAGGDTQVWGLLGCQKEAAFAAKRVIVVVEDVVDEDVIRADPNRTIIPGLIVDAVVVEPWGAHPSYVQGAYDRDNRFYLDWDAITRDEAATQAWLDEWVHGLDGRAAYMDKLGVDRVASLRPGSAPSGSVDYGSYG